MSNKVSINLPTNALNEKRFFAVIYIRAASERRREIQTWCNAMQSSDASMQCSTKNVIKIKEPRKVHNFASARQRVASFGHTKKRAAVQGFSSKKEQERNKAAKEKRTRKRSEDELDDKNGKNFDELGSWRHLTSVFYFSNFYALRCLCSLPSWHTRSSRAYREPLHSIQCGWLWGSWSCIIGPVWSRGGGGGAVETAPSSLGRSSETISGRHKAMTMRHENGNENINNFSMRQNEEIK